MGVQINGSTGAVTGTQSDWSGNVSIGGTLTYEDVTNIDAVGLITARSGIEFGARPGVAASISADGNMIMSGISTFGGQVTTSGRVGINEASPDRDLHVSNTTPYIRVESTSANQPATLELYHTRGNGSDKWPSSVSTADGALTLNVATGNNGAPAEKLRIASDGNTTFKGSGTDVTIKPTDGLIDFGMDGRTAFVTGTNACYIYSGSGASGTIPAGSLVLQARSNVDRDIVFVTGSTPAERFRIKGDGTNTINHPIVFAYAPATSQGLTDNTWTKNTWLTSEDIDTDNAFASSRFTVPAGKAGKYFIAIGANLYGNDNNIRAARVSIFKNGNQYARAYNTIFSTSSSGLRHMQCERQCVATLAVGDYIESYMSCDVQSGILYMSSDNDGVRSNYMMIYKIG